MNMHRFPKTSLLALAAAAVLGVGTLYAHAIRGAIFTTTVAGEAVNQNAYASKADVYLNGGPTNAPGCNGGDLEDGEYYFQVTDPSGDRLLSEDGIAARRFRVANGNISQNLGTHANGAPSPCGSATIQLMPFADTPNNGGEYKVWITRVSDFDIACGGSDCGLRGFVPGHIKTDNFKVRKVAPPPTGALDAYKFYDRNANGAYDSGEIELAGWPMTLRSEQHTVNETQQTGGDGVASFTPLLAGTDYHVTEGTPVQGNWVHSTTIYAGHDGSAQNPGGPLTVVAGSTTLVGFGNYCTVTCNGRTLGFWSNKNGQALVLADDLAMLRVLNLRNASGAHFDPASANALRTWLLDGNAVNMSYMLSVQLAAMALNVHNGFVTPSGYYPAARMTVNELVTAANAALAEGSTATRAQQEQLKNWLDQLNNGAAIVPATPCTYSFN